MLNAPLKFSTKPGRPELAAHIRSIWCYQSSDEHSYERILPGVTTQLLINLHENELRHWSEPGKILRTCGPAGIQGVLTEPVLIDSKQKANLCGVAFGPAGLAMFTGCTAERFTDLIVDATQVWGPASLDLREALVAEADPQVRCQLIEEFLACRLDGSTDQNVLVERVLSLMGEGCSLRSVREQLGLSQRSLLKLFSHHIGVKPKTFARIERFGSVLDSVSQSESFADAAARTGFSDQAHFTREFRAFAGQTPTDHQPIKNESRHVRVPAKKNFKTGAPE